MQVSCALHQKRGSYHIKRLFSISDISVLKSPLGLSGISADFLTSFSPGILKLGTRDQIANIHWIIEKTREFQKNINFCFIDYAKAFDCVDHNKLWKILKDLGIPDHLTFLLRNLYAGRKQQLELDIEQQTDSK